MFRASIRRRALAGVVTAMLAALPVAAVAQTSFVNFESGQVRPLALAPGGGTLYAVNTPDNRLEIFTVSGGSLVHTGSVAVGLEPVAVAARSASEVWVVNHLSDSISIVDVASSPPRVTRTLLVGDEPRDIVFAGPGGNRAFVTAAHRGQNRPGDPQLTTASVGRADVWVFDATNLGASLGGTPVTIVSLFGDTPRALARSADGSRVYVAVFYSGNRTTTVSEGVVCDGGAGAAPCNVSGFTMPGGLPAPNANVQGVAAPEVGLIVKYDPLSSQWLDELGRSWNNGVRFSLPDYDVFALDANAGTPSQVQSWSGVGTTLFNMAVSPTVPGKIYVSNTESRNERRFEGPGNLGTTVRGHLAESRITILNGATVTPRHLNKHIDYDVIPSPPGTIANSLATPLDMAISSDGATLYVAAFGSSKVGVFATATLENGTFTPNAANHVVVSGGGPSGLALDEANGRLYVFTRFDDGISIVDTATKQEVGHVTVHNPEPASVQFGRQFLYDATISSSNGEASCSSCHVFGDLDQLAWDLGNPDDVVTSNPMTIKLSVAAGSDVNGGAAVNEFHPMKGPMTTQTLRGLANSGPMHWRGDRSNGFFGTGTDEALSFDNFIVAFEGLLGRETVIATPDMQAFTDFALGLTLPPNPNRALDNSLTSDQQLGRNFFFGSRRADGIAFGNGLGFNCNGCHVTDASQGFFGTNGDASFENEEQIVKVAHLRNLYQKVGMFGMPAIGFLNAGDNGNKGDQIRGFGFLHDGSVDTVFRFLQATVFNNSNGVGFDGGDPQRRQMEQFMLAFDSDVAPIVGQQVTLTSTNAAVAGPRIDLLIQRAAAAFTSKVLGGVVTECELVVKGTVAGQARGYLRTVGGTFVSDRAAEAPLTDGQLRALAATSGQELTYTCVPPGSGTRIGVDRDEDGYRDRDELDAGSDPADAGSIPPGVTPTPTPTATATATPTRTPTPTATQTSLPGQTATATPTPTATLTATATVTATVSATATRTATPTATRTATPTATTTATPTATQTPIPTPTLAINLVRASKLSVRDDVTPPFSPSGRATQFRSGPYKGSASGVVAPVAGSAGDPTIGGGSLGVYNPTSGAQVTLPLPSAEWTVSGAILKEKYTYRSPKGAPTAIKITVGGGKLGVKVKGTGSFPLAGAPQGTLAVRVRLGSTVEYCSVGVAKVPTSSNDTTAKFVAVSNGGAPASCPAVP